jgi:hypothetical protein
LFITLAGHVGVLGYVVRRCHSFFASSWRFSIHLLSPHFCWLLVRTAE